MYYQGNDNFFIVCMSVLHLFYKKLNKVLK